MQKIVPFLWFDGRAEEAAAFYTATFKDSKITATSHYPESDLVMTVAFTLNGSDFVAINGGPHFQFTPAISFVVNCDTQSEIDTLWDTLCQDGEAGQCGWLTDKFGVSWQVVPGMLGELISGSGPEKADRVMKALLQMTKLDIHTLSNA